MRLGDLAAAVQVERGEGVPDGFEQFVFQAPHGRGRAAPTDLVSPVRNCVPLPPAGSLQTTRPAARSPDRCRPRPPRGHAPLAPPLHLTSTSHSGIPSVHHGDVNNTQSPWGGFPYQVGGIFKARMCCQRNFHHPGEHSRLEWSASAASAGVPAVIKETLVQSGDGVTVSRSQIRPRKMPRQSQIKNSVPNQEG